MEKKRAVKLDGTKETVKAAEEKVVAKAEAVKAAVKETVAEKKESASTIAKAVVEEKKEAPKKETTKPAKEAKSTKEAKKVVKEELKPEVFIQYQGRESVVADAIEKAKAEFVADGHRVSSIKSLQVYLKPEEYAAYYVINEKFAGRVDLF